MHFPVPSPMLCSITMCVLHCCFSTPSALDSATPPSSSYICDHVAVHDSAPVLGGELLTRAPFCAHSCLYPAALSAGARYRNVHGAPGMGVLAPLAYCTRRPK